MKKQSPVDKGWAWVVLTATVINVALNALIYTTGIFNVAFLELFDESKAVTAWCGALHSGLSNLLGVVASMLNAYWGPRKTISFGAACIFIGFTSTFYARTFIHVFITYGIVVGFGFAFTITPGYVMLGFYFKKYRNIVFGIANASIGISNAALAPLLQYLLSEYGMNGTMLITGAIGAHMFVAAALMRPFHQSHLQPTVDEIVEMDVVKERDGVKTSDGAIKNGMKSGSVELHASGTLIAFGSTDGTFLNGFHSGCEDLQGNGTPMTLNTHSAGHNDTTSSCKSVYSEKVDGNIADQKMGLPSRNLKPLLSYPFLAWCANLLLTVAGISCIYLHFPAYAVSMGTSKDKAALLVMVMGLGNMAIRLLLGFLTNNSKTRTFIAYVGTGILASIILFAGPYMSATYLGQMIFACLFAAFGNGYSGLMGPLAIDMLGLDIFNIAFGVGMTLCGVGFIVGPPIAGALYDYTGSYYYTFVMSGACYLLASLLMLPSVCCKHKMK